MAKILLGIPADCTFNQGLVKRALAFPGPYHSYDLSNATDRMPLQLQINVVASIIGKDRAVAWGRLLSGTGFTSTGQTELIKYECGQPMGAYSSWPAMALTHHYIVQLAALRSGHKSYFDGYVLLGDDIMIANSAVAESYTRILKHYDMPYSAAKTHISAYAFEFAKRWFMHGVEVTGFGVGGLLSVRKSYALIHNFLRGQSEHGWTLTLEQAIALVRKLLELSNISSRRRDGYLSLYTVFHYLQELIGPLRDLSLPELDEEKCELLLQSLRLFKSKPLVRAREGPATPFLREGERASRTVFQLFRNACEVIAEKDLGNYQNQATTIAYDLRKWLSGPNSLGAEAILLGSELMA